MFTNLLFLILALLVMDLSPEVQVNQFEIGRLFAALAAFAGLLSLIFLQNRFFRKLGKNSNLLILTQIECIVFLLFLYDVLKTQSFFYFPIAQSLTKTASHLLILIFYFAALYFHYYTAPYRAITSINKKNFAWLQIRFLLPFIIPFFAFQLFIDFLLIIPSTSLHTALTQALEGNSNPLGTSILAITLGIFFMGLIIFFPYLMQTIWKCKPLEDSPLKNRLEQLCKKAKFSHAGLKIWNIMRHSLTAAIIGIVPRFRYVMFTESLIKLFPEEEIKAVLAHEMGHSYHKHLITYPFIFFGMIIIASLIADLAMPLLTQFWQGFSIIWAEAGFYLSVFVLFSLIISLYFRFIFGFFSRLFERQADLHVFRLHLSPYSLINALNRIGVAQGNTHNQPSWHHGSIRERMDYIHMAIERPSIIQAHHRKVKRALIIYFSLFIIASFILII